MSTPSHRLKLQRAEKHLEELRDMVAGVGNRRTYPVLETVETQRNKRRWLYTVHLDDVAPDEHFAIVLGDFLFNVRSALDHLAVAIAPKKRKKAAGFPINVTDPLAKGEDGEYVNREAVRLWLSQTKGLPGDAVASLQRLQPHNLAVEFSIPAEDQVLAVLSALHNADKHRNLVVILTGLAEATYTTDGGQTWLPNAPGRVLQNGALIHTATAPVKVHVEGAAIVGVGRVEKAVEVLYVAEMLLAFIAGDVVPGLEPFVQ